MMEKQVIGSIESELEEIEKKMTMCSNLHLVNGDSGQDMYHLLNTLTFI